MINNVDVLPALGLSDRVCLQFISYKCYCPINHTSSPCYNTDWADIVRMRQMLAAISWEDLLSSLDVQSAYNEFAL